jgi:hypothetical protein
MFVDSKSDKATNHTLFSFDLFVVLRTCEPGFMIRINNRLSPTRDVWVINTTKLQPLEIGCYSLLELFSTDQQPTTYNCIGVNLFISVIVQIDPSHSSVYPW